VLIWAWAAFARTPARAVVQKRVVWRMVVRLLGSWALGLSRLASFCDRCQPVTCSKGHLKRD
jgi:hypothetical protein